MMPVKRLERHIFFEDLFNGFIGQTDGKSSRKPLIYKRRYFTNAGKMVGAKP